MRKLFILTIATMVAILFSTSRGYSQINENEEIKIKEKSSTVTRDFSHLPKVYLNVSNDIITISFENSNSVYNVLVYDSSGVCVLSDIFIANGAAQMFRIFSLNSGLHTILIQNNNSEFEGEFIYQ